LPETKAVQAKSLVFALIGGIRAGFKGQNLDFGRSGDRLRGECAPKGWRPVSKSKVSNMAKAVTIKVKLVSSADTGFYYVAKKNSRTMTDKLVKKKYDPVARKHVEFRESKIK
jgi:large subunit ribosomal protein L33